jgi:hypothetical protein
LIVKKKIIYSDTYMYDRLYKSTALDDVMNNRKEPNIDKIDVFFFCKNSKIVQDASEKVKSINQSYAIIEHHAMDVPLY